MRIILLGLLFILCAIAISKAVAVIVPVTFFYSLASLFNISGDEATIDFVLTANIILSVIMSFALVWLLKGFFRKR
ncbi:hypothetical protein ABEG74_22630 [Pantoea agglomerans]|uniref:hypothetical protein n=1 Tax=Pantoea TaxID=53335 RepID=UPI0032090947